MGKTNQKSLKVVELFAGVGGFRLGLEASNNGSSPNYKVVWSNQWEPSTKAQHASDIYVKHFGKQGHSNEDIATINIKDIPDHNLLVGGFPCQDYSVARSLNTAEGIVGKKGVLWWQIHRVLAQKKKKPQYLMLENVDRLLKSPSKQRGRDFGLMLASLSDLGYAVEWRVINAADYGFPQRRRRVFIMGYYKNTNIYRKIEKDMKLSYWVLKNGVIALAFPVLPVDALVYPEFYIKGDLVELSERVNKEFSNKSQFENTGVMIKRTVLSFKTSPDFNEHRTTLGEILLADAEVPDEYYIKADDIPQWQYLKGAKNILGTSKRTGKTFKYDEGPMVFPDTLDKPSRTIVTGEGGSSPSRFKHIVRTMNGRLRRLTPVELEMLNMFPKEHTEGVSPGKRAFLMGNAVVVGVVKKLGDALIDVVNTVD